MKVFWSWQSDTPGKISRHFVRDVLSEVIEDLRQPGEIEEPSEREAREALHLDHDRKGVSGSPDLAPTIFAKIAQAAVFVADVTLVAAIASSDDRKPKRFINSNVAIEYGYAQCALGDHSILMVQNTYYGDRDDLPFDLKHKAGPIQFCLSPKATRAEIGVEKAKLKGILIEALRLCLGQVAVKAESVKFDETPSVGSRATFWQPGEALAHLNLRGMWESDDQIDYRFAEQRIFYLRLLPTSVEPHQFSVTALHDVVLQRRLEVLTRTTGGGSAGRNRFGAIAYEPHGTAATVRALSQLFRNGEIWGVTSELVASFYGELVIPAVNVKNIYERVLANYVSVARDELGISGPYQIEMGVVGLNSLHISLPEHLRQRPSDVSGPIYEDNFTLRRVLNDTGLKAQQALVSEFIVNLYDLAGISTK